jgi:hypothetical protein
MRSLIVFFTVALIVCGAHAQTRFGVSESDYALVQRWLHTNCLAPEAKPLIDSLISRRAAMQKAFAGALAEGPTPDEIAAVKAAATARWRAQHEFIDNPALKDAMPADQLDALRKQTEDSAVQSEVTDFVNGYRSNAMSGLAVVGDENALRQLRKLAKAGNTPEAVAARGALAYRESLTTR